MEARKFHGTISPHAEQLLAMLKVAGRPWDHLAEGGGRAGVVIQAATVEVTSKSESNSVLPLFAVSAARTDHPAPRGGERAGR
ncbi:MAG: hypothetical protein U0V56_10045 [Actinomycetota bacterium]